MAVRGILKKGYRLFRNMQSGWFLPRTMRSGWFLGGFFVVSVMLFVMPGCPLPPCVQAGYCADEGENAENQGGDGADGVGESGLALGDFREGSGEFHLRLLGKTCEATVDCEGGFCLLDEDKKKYCSQTCKGWCPTGFACVPYEKKQACLRISRNAKGVGKQCRSGFDCKSRTCFPGVDAAICSKRCEFAQCPSPYRCVEAANKAKFCVPQRTFGARCGSAFECEGKACVKEQKDASHYCSRACKGNDCPKGHVCLPTDQGQLCLRMSEKGEDLGRICSSHAACKSRICLDTRVCSRRCEKVACPAGYRCVPWSKATSVKICTF